MVLHKDFMNLLIYMDVYTTAFFREMTQQAVKVATIKS